MEDKAVILDEHLKFVATYNVTKNLYPHVIKLTFNNVPPFWFNNRPLYTMYENSLSIFLSVVEVFMIETVKEAIPYLKFDENLSKEDVLGFCEQEQNHAEMHQKLNACFSGHGYDVDAAIGSFNKLFDKYRKCSLSERLQLTAIVETSASLLGKVILEEWGDKSISTEIKKLYVWHAIEELEHRNIAFLVCNYFHQHKKVYSKKLIFGFLISLNFHIMKATFGNLWHIGCMFRFGNFFDFYQLNFTRHGTSYRIFRALIKFFNPGYNPQTEFDQPDLTASIVRWEQEYHKLGG